MQQVEAMMHKHLDVGPSRLALATDFYQITMMYAYFTAGMDAEATFEYFVRRLPKNRRFLVVAGLEQVLAYLRDLRFTGEDIDYLRSTPTFATVADPKARERFFERLRGFVFGAEVRAAPEGSIVFPNEPILQVRGGLLEGQLVETFLLSVMNFQTLVASKAARMRLVAGERTLIDFGSRRAHGPEAGMTAARAAYVGGFNGTSHVLASHVLGVPVVGTAAHAYTMAFDSEEGAFQHYAATFPETTTLLIDTYDTLRGASRAAKLGETLKGVRLDSGDLAALSKQVRAVLDAEGAPGAKIVVSNDLNELKIQALLEAGAPIDTFGVGTELVTSKDDPALGGVYKLVEKIVDGEAVPTMKFSPSKSTYPGRKEVYRIYGADGKILAGALAQIGEALELGEGERAEPLLRTVDIHGAPEGLDVIQARTLAQLAALPAALAEVVEGGAWEPPALRVTPATVADMEACAARNQRA